MNHLCEIITDPEVNEGFPVDKLVELVTEGRKAINELKRVLSANGSLLFVVPIGKPKIEFNSHRIYSFDQVMSYNNLRQLGVLLFVV